MAKTRQPVEATRRIPRQQRAAETVAAILEGAAQILEAGGLAAFTTNAVAERLLAEEDGLTLAGGLAAAFFGYLLLGSQWFNPWYLLWLTPLALAAPSWQLRALALAFALLAPLTYLLQYDARLIVPVVFVPVAVLAIRWRAALGWGSPGAPIVPTVASAPRIPGRG